jgi:acyl carrier protein
MLSLRETIYRRLTPLLAESLGAEEEEINWDTNVYDDLNADALEFHDEVIPLLEETFGVEIDDEYVPELTTVREMVDYLAENT